jgi:hypothetical protein
LREGPGKRAFKQALDEEVQGIEKRDEARAGPTTATDERRQDHPPLYNGEAHLKDIMIILARVLVVAWALVSVGLGALAFAAVQVTGGGIGAAAYEAVETIPEAASQIMGFDGAPLVVVVVYWLALAAAVLLAFRQGRRDAS